MTTHGWGNLASRASSAHEPEPPHVSVIHDCAAELREIASRLRRTAPVRRRHPEAWFEERDELSHAVKTIAERLEREHALGRKPPSPAGDR